MLSAISAAFRQLLPHLSEVAREIIFSDSRNFNLYFPIEVW
jgi:hypothetical protein